MILINPTVFYLSSTALTEPVLLAAMMATFAGLTGWLVSAKPYSAGALIVYAGIPAACAVLTRYDAWALLVAWTVFVGIVTWRRWGGATRTLKMMLAFATPSLAMIVLWLLYGWLQFGDPLAFQRGPNSAQAQQKVLEQLGLLTTKGELFPSISAYTWTTLYAVGIPAFILGFLGLLSLVWGRALSSTALLIYSMFAPFGFYVLSLFLGQAVISTDKSFPAGWLNVRYGAIMVPLTALLVGAGIHFLFQIFSPRVSLVLATIMLVTISGWNVYCFASPEQRVPVVMEGHDNLSANVDGRTAGHWLASKYASGDNILLDENASPFLPDIGIPLRDMYGRFAGDLFDKALAHPRSYVQWVLVKRTDSDKVWASVSKREDFTLYYHPVFESGAWTVYERTNR